MSFRWNSGQIGRNLTQFSPKVEGKMDIIFASQAQRGEAHMKLNAPWADRTGAARNGLYTRYSKTRTTREILFSHSVAYGIWLEIANSGDYQIILPTIRVIGRDTMAQLQDLFGDLR
jgi:hypothetical protein